MWTAIRELMEQFDEAVIVLDDQGEIAVLNAAAREEMTKLGTLEGVSGIRVLKLAARTQQLSYEKLPGLAVSHLDSAASGLPVVLSIRSLKQYLYISPAFQNVFGDDATGFFADVNALLGRVHPDDRDRVKGHLDADQTGEAQEYECRILHTNGEWRKLRIRVHPFFDGASGQMLIAALAEDVTALKVPKKNRRAKDNVAVLSSTAEFRNALDQQCADVWSTNAEAPSFGVAFIDLARFRAVNDSFGYAGGDLLLKEVSRRIESAVPKGSLLAGFGSDRFGLLLRSCANSESAEELVRQILIDLSEPIVMGEGSISVQARAGMAFASGLDCSADALLRDADAALQLAKKRRETLAVSKVSRSSKSMEQSSLEFDLRKALDNDEFFFEFQPVFDPSTGDVKLLEALVRWRHPRLGVISPSSFISLAEDSGLVLRLDMQGLERLAKQLEYWRTLEPKMLEVPVSINISGRHFPTFVMEKQFHQLLQKSAVGKGKIIFEITESVFVESNQGTAAGLGRLRDAGVEIWLDDFGEGYSSFRYLAHFPIDGIKISEVFVKHCAKEEKSRVILGSMQTLARGLGVQTVVEGVENSAQFEVLKTMGFDALQGFYLSRPLEAVEIPALLRAGRKSARPA